MKAYKGFDKNLKCRNFQYDIGKEYEEKEASLCNKGFHACENPIEVFRYYPPADSRYCDVELDDISEQISDDSKRCAKRIKIGAEIGIKGIVDAFINFTFNKIDWKNAKVSNTGDWSAATNTGDWSAATNTGDWSAATVEGEESIAIVTGYGGKAKGAIGCWIVVTERGEWNGVTYPILCVKTAKVDGDTIKENTFYKVVNGEFKED